MVSESAPLKVKRSLVALPLSGTDSSAPPSVMDLGNVSIEASSIVVDKQFPAIEKLLLPEQLPEKPVKKVAAKPKNNNASGVKVVKRLNQTKSTPSQSSVRNAAVNQLLEERSRLIRENSSIAKKLVMFEKMLRMKKVLGSRS